MKQTISYAGFTFPNPRLNVVEEALFDEADLAQIGTRFTFSITGHVTGADLTLFKQQLTCMRARLNQPRKEFFVDWSQDDGSGPERLFSFDGTGNADWGPIPGELRVEQFAGGRAATYAWSVTVTAKDCVDECTITNNAADIISNTRAWTHAIDENGFTTRTIAGRLILRASAVQAGRGADYYRYRCVAGVPSNFKRTAQSFVQSEDGRVLTFSVTDVEQMWTLPLPISSGRADFSVRLADLALIADYNLSGEFSAPATVSKATILDRIFALIVAKFPISQIGFFFEDREFTEEVYGNSIRFSISAKSPVGTAAGGQPDYAAALGQLTVSPPNSTGDTQIIDAYGQDGTITSGAIAQAPKAYDACNPQPNNNPSTSEGGSVSYEPGAPQPPVGTPTPTPSTISPGHEKAPYESLHEVYSYEVDNKLVFFDPKTAGQPPVMQQTAMPSLTIIQAGYFRQYARYSTDVSSPPNPTIPANGVVLSNYVSPATPQPVGDGSWNLYSVNWRYVIRCNAALTGSGTVIPEFPVDLRRQDVTAMLPGEAFPPLPPGLVIVPA